MIICCNGNKYLGNDKELYDEEQDIWYIEGNEGEIDLETAIENKTFVFIYKVNNDGTKCYLRQCGGFLFCLNQCMATQYMIGENGLILSNKIIFIDIYSIYTMYLMNSDPFSYVLK